MVLTQFDRRRPVIKLEGRKMTTVDFWANRLDRTAPVIALENGLFGAATTAFHRLADAINEGRVEGKADWGSASATLSGAELREILRGLGGTNAAVSTVMRKGHHDEETLMVAIDDHGVYGVSAVEV